MYTKDYTYTLYTYSYIYIYVYIYVFPRTNVCTQKTYAHTRLYTDSKKIKIDRWVYKLSSHTFVHTKDHVYTFVHTKDYVYICTHQTIHICVHKTQYIHMYTQDYTHMCTQKTTYTNVHTRLYPCVYTTDSAPTLKRPMYSKFQSSDEEAHKRQKYRSLLHNIV